MAVYALNAPSTPTVLTQAELLKRRYDSLKASPERSNCETHWQEIGELISPRKVDFVGMRTPGEKKMNRVYDPTGIQANEMLAAGLHGMATNPATKWFSLRMIGMKVPDPNNAGEMIDINKVPAVQKYLSNVEDVMWQRIYQPGTNFTTSLHENYLDLGSFGTSVLFAGQRDDGGLLFEARSLAECVIAENHEGRVDTVFRKTTYTVRQMMQMAESDGWTVSDKVKALYASNKYDDPITVIHGVYPRKEREPDKKDRKNMPFASCYFEHEGGHELESSGFPEFPYLVPRWSKYAGEIYGRSPAMVALPDVKMLQAMQLTKIKIMQKSADPPMWLRDDGVVGQTRTVPGGINYWRGNPNDGVMLQPVNMSGIQYLVEDIKMLREQILKTFYADLMRMTERADMTATEVVARTSEQMRLFGPLIGRLESEMLGPMIERIFGILTRLNLLPEPPPEIQGSEFTVEYVSPIATAQKQQSASGIVQVSQLLLNSFGPDVAAQIAAKNIDINKFFKWAWDLFNNDPDLLKDDDDLESDDQKQQVAQSMQMAAPAADMAQKGSVAVRNIADAAQKQGMDVPAMLAQFMKQVQRNPEAQQNLRDMAGNAGLSPSNMGALTPAPSG